jgi:flagellar protein FlgJ
MKSFAATAKGYTDLAGLNALRTQARKGSSQALSGVAGQFEALFIGMMLQSMRQASGGSDVFGGQQVQLFRDMYDKQLAQSLAGQKKMGISALLTRQLGAKASADPEASAPSPAATPLERKGITLRPIHPADRPIEMKPSLASREIRDRAPASSINSPQEFIDTLWPFAEEAASELGVAPEVLLAQSALETGWGQKIVKHGNGEHSHNLFGIKADRRWVGESVSVRSLEFESSAPRIKPSSFRAYRSYAESFKDYVEFIRNNPRYADALKNAGDPHAYVNALQEAGYATDPNYANKIKALMQHHAIRDVRMVADSSSTVRRA